ncbi:MAG: DUF4118 domain-containing protein [Thermomicrobiales bacterium]
MWQSFFEFAPHETPRERRSGYGAALAAVALVTGVIGLVHAFAQIANISILYLIAVLVISSRFGRGPAIAASFAAFFAFNWFFVEQYHTLTVAHTEEVIALFVLLTAVVRGQLAAVSRARNRELLRREREAQLLRAIVATLNDPNLAPGDAQDAVETRLGPISELQSARIDVGSASQWQIARRPPTRRIRVLVLNAEAEGAAGGG